MTIHPNSNIRPYVSAALWKSVKEKALRRFPHLAALYIEGREYIFARNARTLIIPGATLQELTALNRVAEGYRIP